MGRGLSELQKRIIAAALDGREKFVREHPDGDPRRICVFLSVPLKHETVAEYFAALARYRQWKKLPWLMRKYIAEKEGKGDPWGEHSPGLIWDEDAAIVLKCGIHEAIHGIESECRRVWYSLPGRLGCKEGVHVLRDADGRVSESPAYVCAYDFSTREEAEAFFDEHAQAIADGHDLPGASLSVGNSLSRSWPDLLLKEAVLLAGNGKRTASAEAVASRAIARLERRGLAVADRATSYELWRPRALWLTANGIAVAGSIAPDVAERIAELRRQHEAKKAADEARRIAEQEAWKSSPEGQAATAEAHEAMREIQSLLAGIGAQGAPA